MPPGNKFGKASRERRIPGTEEVCVGEDQAKDSKRRTERKLCLVIATNKVCPIFPLTFVCLYSFYGDVMIDKRGKKKKERKEEG